MRTVYSCVVDHHPKFLMEAWNWLLGLQSAGIRAGDDTRILIHHPEDMPSAQLETLRAEGAELVPFTAFGTGPAAYCNKLRQLETPAILQADRVFLCDADLLVLRDLAEFASDKAIRAKPVDKPNPPEQVLEALFDRAGLPFPGWSEADFAPKNRTPRGNCNGGLYLISGPMLPALAEAWPRWSRFCLDQGDLLTNWLHHSDQLGFMLAMAETGLPFDPLPAEANFPTHFRTAIYAAKTPVTIAALHYHGKTDPHGLPAPVGVEWIDRQIAAGNSRLRRTRRSGFDNALFWDYRYAEHPELGSGLGSRGEVLDLKRGLLAPVLRDYATKSVVDIGCGDLETMRDAALSDYHGVDPSASALALAREKRPDWQFTQGGTAEVPAQSADLAICLDVAIHQPSPESYHSLINGLIASARDAVLVSGYEEAGERAGIVYFHEPLSQTLANHPAVETVTELGGWRDVRLFLAKLNRAPRNPHDIRPDGLSWGMANCPTPDLLGDLVRLSRAQLGFFPSTIIRTLEYPWMASRLRDCAGQRILDVGAGVAVMPLWLAGQGAEVETVDPHKLARELAKRESWNEWGFLDYALLDGRIRSHRVGIQDLNSPPFDTVYSVSVIEHMPAAIRRMALERITGLLKPGGRLLLTLDLTPGTEDLWPLSEGKEVDPDAPHGTVSDLLAELRALGFTLLETTLRRHIPGSRTDLLLLDAILPAKAG